MTQQMWQDRYAKAGPVWSGRVNHWLAELTGADRAADPGTALDLACGEGGDAVWLAGLGWQVTAVDFAPAALERGSQAAQAAGLADRIRWVHADLAEWEPAGLFDLVTVSFLHLPDRSQREAALRKAWRATAGRLLVVAHDPENLTQGTAGGPPDPGVLYSAADILHAVDVPADDPRVLIAQTRRRTTPAGLWVDAVVLLRR